MTAEFRKTNTTTPVVLMGYANPVEHMGYETFAQAAKAAGVDGVLTVDIPPEESAGVSDVFKAHDLDPIFLLSPTTPESRVEQVAAAAGGFIYYVSLKGVTGSANLDTDEVAREAGHGAQALQPAGRRRLRHPRRGDRRGRGADCRRRGGGQPHRERDRDRAGRRVRQPRQTLVAELRRGVDAASK
jgi:tryptophan synthase alpha chain